MSDILKDVKSQFSKDELIAIAGEMGLTKGVAGTKADDIVTMILADLEENGVPDVGDISELFGSFLVVAEIIDEEGNIIEEKEDVKYPECFGWADKRDPACTKCSVMELCIAKRIASRPECFGLLFLEHEPECQACIEAPDCKIKTLKGVK